MRAIAIKLMPITMLVTCSVICASVSAETPAAVAPAAVAPAAVAPAAVAPAAAAPAAVAPAAVAPAAAAPAAAAVNLSGNWSSNLVGNVTLEQTGSKVSGTYHYEDDKGVTQDGKIEGTLKDKTVQAKWWERPKVGSGEESRGDLEWKMAEDGKTLAGWYRSEGEKEKEDWNLSR